MTTWKISTNSKYFDYESAIRSFEQNGSFILWQSKGRANMVNVPKINDKVIITCDKKEILKGYIKYEFTNGTKHTTLECPFSKGNSIHRNELVYAGIMITEKGSMNYLRGCQRTWCKYNL